MPIDLHGKEYTTVVERLKMLHDDIKHNYSLQTEKSIACDKYLFIKATLTIKDQVYTGHAMGDLSTNKKKLTEATETHAIGRALASYGLSGGEFSSAEEIADFIHESNTIKKEESLTIDSIPFKKGKDAGKPIKELSYDSLVWIADKSTMSSQWKALADKLIDEVARDQEEQDSF